MKKTIIVFGVLAVFLTGVNIFVSNHKAISDNNVSKIIQSASYPKFDLPDLVSYSQVIVTGVVEKIGQPMWNNRDNKKPDTITGSDTIYRDVTIKVSNVEKGSIKGDKVIVRLFGGTVDGFIIDNTSQPELTEGMEIVSFLIPDSTPYNKEKSADHYIFKGAAQGVYKLQSDQAENVHGKIKLSDFRSIEKEYLAKPKVKQPVVSQE